jgi:putative nucleotidyltransferase with HDIG domain
LPPFLGQVVTHLMTRDSFIPRHGAAYVLCVIASGFCVIAFSAYDVAARMLTVQWFTLAALTLLSGSATVKLPSVPATISISETFVFTSVLLFGPSAGATIVALDGLIISIWLAKTRKEFYRVAFNMSAPAISIWLASGVYYSYPAVHPLLRPNPEIPIELLLVPLLSFTLSHFLINSWLIAFAVGFETKRRPFEIWRSEFLWLSLNYFGGASVSALLVVYTQDITYTYLGIIIPLLLILYFTFKIPMARVEDANRHLQKVNSLYLSTIETLALAIDAKDQVTHGHIRRVQNYTLALAKALGIRDDLMLRAIEASALLHDMGKLAIPEHILNKPGKLTAAEFDKMKLHASIGAEILSSIEFPYPVVPIVRHHHENWDGTGYPAGIQGTQIPIGARILSVVDCFDALTSDRPYRPALSDDEAVKILMQRRGNMYDPLIVDTFVRIRKELVASFDHSPPPVAKAIAKAQQSEPIAARPDSVVEGDGLALFLLYQVLTDFVDRGWDDAADLVTYRLSQVVPLSRAAVFAYDTAADVLVCVSTHGPGLTALRGRPRRLGEGLSGWVAANRRAIMNSLPALDLANLCPGASSELSSTLSVPLILRDSLVGVLTIYARSEQAFNEHHRQIAEGIAPHIAGLLGRARVFTSAAESALPNFPNARHLDYYIRQRLQGRNHSPFALIVLRLDQQFSQQADVTFLEQVAAFAAANLRGADLVFVCGVTTLVCLLADGNELAAESVRERLLAFHVPHAAGQEPQQLCAFRSTIVRAPRDGETLAELLSSADELLATIGSSVDVPKAAQRQHG